MNIPNIATNTLKFSRYYIQLIWLFFASFAPQKQRYLKEQTQILRRHLYDNNAEQVFEQLTLLGSERWLIEAKLSKADRLKAIDLEKKQQLFILMQQAILEDDDETMIFAFDRVKQHATESWEPDKIEYWQKKYDFSLVRLAALHEFWQKLAFENLKELEGISDITLDLAKSSPKLTDIERRWINDLQSRRRQLKNFDFYLANWYGCLKNTSNLPSPVISGFYSLEEIKTLNESRKTAIDLIWLDAAIKNNLPKLILAWSTNRIDQYMSEELKRYQLIISKLKKNSNYISS